jgi:type IV pilus assembly protein PilZ
MSGQRRMLALKIVDKTALHLAWMPFLKHGGVFVPTHNQYHLGDDVYLFLTLIDDPEKHPVHGKVVWITPHGCQGGRPQGIGVLFPKDDAARALKGRIEVLLASVSSRAVRPNHTM